MNYESYGNMSVRTYTAAGALPVKDVLVKVYGTDEYNRDVKYSLLTDSDGMTNVISLPAPLKKYSTAPSPSSPPYSVYNFELAKEGYYFKKIDNVPVFSGITAVLPIEMIPLNYSDDGKVLPGTNLNSTIYENENL